MLSGASGRGFPSRLEIVENWLPRYTGTSLKEFGRWILLTNFQNYVQLFAEREGVAIRGVGGPMTSATSRDGITIINYGLGSSNAATIMDLLTAVSPAGVLFLGKCGGLKKSTEVGQYILPIAAIRGEGTGNEYMPPEVPAMPSFKLHEFVASVVTACGIEYRTGVIYTTNRRVWEHDTAFRDYLRRVRAIGIDMETATIFLVGHANSIPRGALLLVTDVPMLPEGIKTEDSDRDTTRLHSTTHLEIGIEAMRQVRERGELIKHFHFE